MRPILFNTEMVRALLDNRKTVTRRAVKPQPIERAVLGETGCYVYRGIPCGLDGMTNFAPYRRGDILYVRETWAELETVFGVLYYAYKADDQILHHSSGENFERWRPSIHMPREAARIFLRATEVRVERLQDISEDQAISEGFESFPHEPATVGFADSWNSTIRPTDRARYGWDANPWVWVIEFERIDKQESSGSKNLHNLDKIDEVC